MKHVTGPLGGAARRAPLTFALLVGVGSAGLLRSQLRGHRAGVHHGVRPGHVLDAGHPLHHPLSVALSFLWAPDARGFVCGAIALLLVGVLAEHRLGTARYATALVATHVVVMTVVVAGGWYVATFRPEWSRAFLTVRHGGLTFAVIGAGLAASAGLPPLWRRRVQVGCLALLITLALFFGGGLAALLLVAAGFGSVFGRVLGATRVERSAVSAVHESRVLVAALVAATGLGPLLAALSPAPAGPFAMLGFLVADIRGNGPNAVATLCSADPTSIACVIGRLHQQSGVGLGRAVLASLPAVVLLLIADGLRRGRRMAWVAGIVVEAGLAVVAVGYVVATWSSSPAARHATPLPHAGPLHMLTWLAIPCLIPLAGVLVALIAGRGLFPVRAPRGSARTLTQRLALLAVGTTATYVGVGLLAAGQWRTLPSAWTLLTDLPLRLAPPELTLRTQTGTLPTGPVTRLLVEWIGVASWAIATSIIVRSYRRRSTATRGERERARKILIRNGGASLAWMGLWKGNDYWFSRSGRTYVAYRVLRGVALTIGDPVGPAAERMSAVRDFTRYCESIGAVPCFYSATEQLAEMCSEDGWRSVQIAEETVLPLGALAFTGKRFQDLRTTLNRAAREGVRVEWIDFRTAPRALVLQIEAVSDAWVAQQSLPEMGFTLGGIGQLNDPYVRCSVAVDDSGRVHAVASWLPIFDDGEIVGWTLDFMRRNADGFRQGSELLIARAALDLQAEGCRVLSLSGAPLARAGSEGETTTGASTAAVPSDALDRLLDLVGTRLEPVYGFRSLLRFKAKFGPQYHPMYLLYADAASLPTIGRAVAHAYVPDLSLALLLEIARAIVVGHRPARTRHRPRAAAADVTSVAVSPSSTAPPTPPAATSEKRLTTPSPDDRWTPDMPELAPASASVTHPDAR